ncbi:MAG: DUF1385 domain-containing protein [Winogradskyella sp.]|nr:MAG: DUF1385 domain-containing protein [Winogradskyella sp.]
MHKILKIVAAILGVLGIVFLVRIISAGDEAIEAAAANGDTALVEPIAWVSYIMLGLVLAFVVFFVIKNLFTNTAGLKNTLIGVGLFVAVLLISYVLASSTDAIENGYMYDGVLATETESKLVGTGLRAFYVLILGAAAAMIFSGVKKIINK